MRHPKDAKTIEFKPQFSPEFLAKMEIESLDSYARYPDLNPDFVLGGRMSDEMRAENARKKERKKERILEIIKKYGVAEHYLKPLRERKAKLEAELKAVDAEIAALEVL